MKKTDLIYAIEVILGYLEVKNIEQAMTHLETIQKALVSEAKVKRQKWTPGTLAEPKS